MLRIVISFVVAFAAAALGGKGLIPLLRRMKAGQSIKEIGPTWHMSKQGTPTMGGLMFIIGSAAAVLLLGWPDFAAGRFGGGFVLLFALVFGVIGYIDDYVKVKKHQNTGLTAPQKFLLQLAAAIVFTVLMRNHHYLTPDLYIPFVNVTLSLPWPVYMVFAAFVMVGTVNAVNITDGIDGLATGVTMPVMLFFTAVAQDADQAVVLHRILKGLVEFLLWIGVALLFKSLPLDGLGGFDKFHQGAEVQGHAGVHRGPVACVRGLLPAASGRDQKGFNILFKLLFVVRHTLFLLVLNRKA